MKRKHRSKKLEARRRIFVFFICVAAIVYAGVSLFSTKDVDSLIQRTENSVLSVLASCGITDSDIIYREENVWKEKSAKWKTVTYVFDAEGMESVHDIPRKMRDAISRIKQVKIGSIAYRRGKENSGRARVDVEYKGRSILSVVMKNVKPTWIKSSGDTSGYVEKPPLMAIVLDTMGDNRENIGVLKDLGVPVTLVFSPKESSVEEVCAFAKEDGMEVVFRLSDSNNNVFLDYAGGAQDICDQLTKIGYMAKKKGKIIAVGRSGSGTVEALKRCLPEMRRNGIKFVTLEEMIDPEKG